MNGYQPQQYYVYYPAQYEPMWTTGLINFIVVIALGAWAISLVRKAIKGEEVEYPL